MSGGDGGSFLSGAAKTTWTRLLPPANERGGTGRRQPSESLQTATTMLFPGRRGSGATSATPGAAWGF